LSSSEVLSIRGLVKKYKAHGREILVLDNIGFDVGEEFIAILGPSGCGKSTLQGGEKVRQAVSDKDIARFI